MKIDFSKKEYKFLVTMIEIADWIMNSHHPSERNDTNGYRDLRNKILAFCNEMGMGEYYKERDGEYFETSQFEENSPIHEFIDEYDNDSFWDELVTRLADRDYYRQYGNQQISSENRINMIAELEKFYSEEIEKNGLKNFSLTSISSNRKATH